MNSYRRGFGAMHDEIPYETQAVIYDFTVYKLNKMIAELKEVYAEHPDMFILEMMRDAYAEGNLAIHWIGGYPMANL